MDLERELTRVLEDILNKFSVGNRFKLYWCRRSRAKTCDLIVSLIPVRHVAAGINTSSMAADCLQKMLCEVVKKSKEWHVSLERCEVVSDTMLQINVWLNRATLTASVLNSIQKDYKAFVDKETCQPSPKFRARIFALAVGIGTKSCSLTDLRSLILMELIKRILETKGCELWVSHSISCNGICESVCNSDCETLMTKNCQSPTQPSEQIGSQDDAKCIEIDQFGPINYFKHVIHDHVQKTNACFLVVPQHAESHTISVKEFRNTLMEQGSSFPLIRLVHGPVVWRTGQPTCTTAEQLYRMQRDIVKNSFVHKYGFPAVDEDDSQADAMGSMFDHLADLNIKFHMLSCSTSKTLRLKIDESDCGGTFVMYNYARICLLLSNFEKSIHCEALAPLPPFGEVDFSLLKKEEEWDLVLLLAKYPKLIHGITCMLQDCNSDSSINPAFHTIIEFMSELAHRVSVYYRHVRVLMSAVHLKDTMVARLWLLKCVKRILEDIFRLLNVTPVKQM